MSIILIIIYLINMRDKYELKTLIKPSFKYSLIPSFEQINSPLKMFSVRDTE